MARLDIDHIELQSEEADLADTVREVMASVKPELDGRPFELNSPTELPRTVFDPRLLKLAVKQLIDNALKYSTPGSPVSVKLQRVNGRISLDVTNHGEPIPPQEQGRIFERFYRGLGVRGRIPGSGLGLNIAHRIAEAHNGELTVVSNPGETTFRITLPIVDAAKPA